MHAKAISKPSLAAEPIVISVLMAEASKKYSAEMQCSFSGTENA
jgi:hypothetical protein